MRTLIPVALAAFMPLVCLTAATGDTTGAVDYLRDIKPILADSCYTCHGPDENTRQADLRFDVREIVVGQAITPGESGESEMIARIISPDPDVKMPPPESHRPTLTKAQVELLRRWIDQGAEFQKHWAYVQPVRPDVPSLNPREKSEAIPGSANPIDQFILAKLKSSSPNPSTNPNPAANPTADPRTLIRRLSFDVTGLPPTYEAVKKFSDEPTEERFRKLVDEYVDSPRFGERMAVYWLDVVRYADSTGIHGDQENSMSPYRDYVIDAFNNNMPFDRFLVEQLAGDLLPDATQNQKIASAFNRLHMITNEGGAQPGEYLAIYSADRVRNVGAALLGSTLGCCQCHDHKFDPFSITEFYQFASYFADLKETGVYGGDNWFPKLEVPTENERKQLDKLQSRVNYLRTMTGKDAKEDSAEKMRLADAEKQLGDFKKSLRTVLVSQSVAPRTMRVLRRGNWQDDKGDVVLPATPQSLNWSDAANGASDDSTSGESNGNRQTRLDLAKWMTDARNPLTARVFVNRLWKLMFGEGIVTTLDDFGSQGAVPSHPDLLDWLAIEFIESGWDVKHMVRLIVNSRTYQQSSLVPASNQDPANRMLARQRRFRIDAEFIRDNALTASNLIVHRIGGRSVKPYQPGGYYAHLNFPKRQYQADKGESLYRRGLYTHWQRTFLHPSMKAFDAPTREECTVQRPQSNTPLQSLVLLNDPIYTEAARALATRLIGIEEPKRLDRLFELVLQRHPTDEEVAVLEELFNKHLAEYESDTELARRINQNGVFDSGDVSPSELAAWTSVVRSVLSLHETITRY